MYRSLLSLLLLACCRSSSGRVAPQNGPWNTDKDISNVQLLHPVLSSKPADTFSKIPAEAFTLDPEMTKRKNEHKYKGKISALTGEHLTDTVLEPNVEELPDIYLILVKKYDDNEGNSVRDKLGDYIKYRAGSDARYADGNDVKYDDGLDVAAAIANAFVSGDDRTTDDGQSSEFYTPSGPIIHHKPHYYGPTPLTDDQHQIRNNINIPIFKKQSSHSIYLDKDFNPDALDDKNIKVIPKIYPSKFMMNENVATKPEPLVVYVNKDLPSDTSHGLRSLYKPQESSLPMSVYVDNNYPHENDNKDDDAKTLQELINEMHDPRHPTPFKVLINKEEPQKQKESDSKVEHLNHLIRQIRALNQLLHGSDSPEPYTMYVNDEVIASEEEPTPTPVQHQHVSTVDEDSEQIVAHAICDRLGAAFCPGNFQRDDVGEGTTKSPVVARRRAPRRERREFDDEVAETLDSVKQNQWAVFNHEKDQKLKQYIYVSNGHPFLI